MEILNYSLWFTLVCWAVVTYVWWETEPDITGLSFISLFFPAFAILLEYLIVRG